MFVMVVFSFSMVLLEWNSFSKMLMENTSWDLLGGVFPVLVSASYNTKSHLKSTHNIVV